MKRVAAVLVTAAAMLGAATSSADAPPSIWQRAREPEARAIYQLHVTNELALRQRTGMLPTARIDLGEAVVQAARDRVLRADATIQQDPRIQFDLGALYGRLLDYRKSAEITQKALEKWPDHPAADDAWHVLSDACGHVGDHVCEKKSYLEILRRETEEPRRGTPTLNLAETEMHLGNLRDAIEGYREALRIAGHLPRGSLAPLAVWGLAVALDRSGDRVGGEREAKFALSLEDSSGYQRLLRSSGVFFVPQWEVLWYEGLGAAALARGEPDRDTALQLWQRAERSFTSYVEQGERGKDPWIAIAKARLAAITAERLKTEKRKPSPKAPRPDDGSVVF